MGWTQVSEITNTELQKKRKKKKGIFFKGGLFIWYTFFQIDFVGTVLQIITKEIQKC